MKQFRDMPYLVSEDGQIWSELSNRFLKPYLLHTGYYDIQLGSKFRSTVHRIVAEVYCENPTKEPWVNHIDGNKTNNHYKNLEWSNCSKNTQHAHDNGLIISSKGEHRPTSKLTESQVKEIRFLYKTTRTSHRKLAKQYNVSYTIIAKLINRQTWKHVE